MKTRKKIQKQIYVNTEAEKQQTKKLLKKQ